MGVEHGVEEEGGWERSRGASLRLDSASWVRSADLGKVSSKVESQTAHFIG